MIGEKRELRPLKYTNLPGFSENLLKQHYTLYAGYIKKTNEIRERLQTAFRTEANATFSELRAIKLEETFAYNGVKLHEAYFACLGGDGEPEGDILHLIKEDYGSYENWLEDFKAAAQACRGWVVLAYDFDENKVHNYSCDSHNQGSIWNCLPLLVLDMYEHAYHIDYGTDKKGYIEAFLKNIDWTYVNNLIKEYNLIERRQRREVANGGELEI
jgi:Fe-Mn family superoxide dismutase